MSDEKHNFRCPKRNNQREIRFIVLPTRNPRLYNAKEMKLAPNTTMEFLIKVCIHLIQIVYKIIEGVIRSLLEVLIPTALVFTAVSLCVIGLILLTRSGGCTGENICFESDTLFSCIKLAGCAFTLYAAYKVYKTWFES